MSDRIDVDGNDKNDSKKKEAQSEKPHESGVLLEVQFPAKNSMEMKKTKSESLSPPLPPKVPEYLKPPQPRKMLSVELNDNSTDSLIRSVAKETQERPPPKDFRPGSTHHKHIYKLYGAIHGIFDSGHTYRTIATYFILMSIGELSFTAVLLDLSIVMVFGEIIRSPLTLWWYNESKAVLWKKVAKIHRLACVCLIGAFLFSGSYDSFALFLVGLNAFLYASAYNVQLVSIYPEYEKWFRTGFSNKRYLSLPMIAVPRQKFHLILGMFAHFVLLAIPGAIVLCEYKVGISTNFLVPLAVALTIPYYLYEHLKSYNEILDSNSDTECFLEYDHAENGLREWPSKIDRIRFNLLDSFPVTFPQVIHVATYSMIPLIFVGMMSFYFNVREGTLPNSLWILLGGFNGMMAINFTIFVCTPNDHRNARFRQYKTYGPLIFAPIGFGLATLFYLFAKPMGLFVPVLAVPFLGACAISSYIIYRGTLIESKREFDPRQDQHWYNLTMTTGRIVAILIFAIPFFSLGMSSAFFIWTIVISILQGIAFFVTYIYRNLSPKVLPREYAPNALSRSLTILGMIGLVFSLWVVRSSVSQIPCCVDCSTVEAYARLIERSYVHFLIVFGIGALCFAGFIYIVSIVLDKVAAIVPKDGEDSGSYNENDSSLDPASDLIFSEIERFAENEEQEIHPEFLDENDATIAGSKDRPLTRFTDIRYALEVVPPENYQQMLYGNKEVEFPEQHKIPKKNDPDFEYPTENLELYQKIITHRELERTRSAFHNMTALMRLLEANESQEKKYQDIQKLKNVVIEGPVLVTEQIAKLVKVEEPEASHTQE